MNIKDLKPNPKNPRTITDQKLKMLENSLKEYGSLDGFIFNQKTKQMVSGHQRLKFIPTDAKIVIDKKYSKATKTGTLVEGHILIMGERFPYREVNWNSQKEKAANLAANRGAGEWDTEILSEWMKELDDGLFDLDLTMFDEMEIGSLSGVKKHVAFDADFNPSDSVESDKKHKVCPHCGENL